MLKIIQIKKRARRWNKIFIKQSSESSCLQIIRYEPQYKQNINIYFLSVSFINLAGVNLNFK